MASLSLPDIDFSTLDLSQAGGAKKLREYIYILTEQLRYVLSNIETENLGSQLAGDMAAISTRASEAARAAKASAEGLSAFKAKSFAPTVEQFESALRQSAGEISLKVARAEFASAVPCYSALDPAAAWSQEERAANAGFLWYDSGEDRIKQWDGSAWLSTLENSFAQRAYGAIKVNAEGISQRVQKGSVLSEINQSPETVKIQAQRIALEGAVSVNGSFKIDEEGYLSCSGGSIGDFSVDAKGGLFGTGDLKVGGMTLTGNAANGLKSAPDLEVKGENLLRENYPGNGLIYFLGLDAQGELCLCDLAIMDHSTGELAAGLGLYAFTPGEAPERRATAALKVIQISSRGDGLAKRASASTAAPSLGSCAAGEIYDAQSTLYDGEGYLWTCCTRSFILVNGRYSGSLLPSPFWVRQYSNGQAYKYYDFTTISI